MFRNLITSLIILIGILAIATCADTPEEGANDIDKYLGTWNVSDQSARINYTVTIEPNPSNSAEILMNNFADLSTTAVALVIGNSLVIDSQTLGSGTTINGSGSFVATGKLQFNFDLNDGIDNESRLATFTR